MKIYPAKTGSCVVITGGTRGIGLGLANAFLNLGWSVIIAGRQEKQLIASIDVLRKSYQQNDIEGVICDVTKIEDLKRLWEHAALHFGAVHVWINNAGTCNPAKSFKDLSPEEIRTVMDTNILGTILGSQVALNGMLAQGFGQIFNMEGWGSRGEWSEGMTPYSTSKQAVAYFSRVLVKEVKNTSILIGTLSPGMVATDLLISSWQHGDIKNWQKMRWLFHFIIDPPEQVCAYLAQRVSTNKSQNVRFVWMTPWRLILRFFQPYYLRRNPIKGTALDSLN
jgi:NAD(P)-dependent dehydrogenase (short-subunit alcohol dehydrogenase family)